MVWRDAGLKTAMLIRTFESLAIRKKSILDFFFRRLGFVGETFLLGLLLLRMVIILLFIIVILLSFYYIYYCF